MKYIVIYFISMLLLVFSSCGNESNIKEENKESAEQAISNSEKEQQDSVTANEIQEEKQKDLVSKEGNVSLFSGQAEIATYTLSKARYEENHPGESVLIFVTEPFLNKRQVKADHPTPDNSVNVLKLNRIDRFNTGIYDYSQFTSVFTPVDIEKAKYPLKITMGSQDWCGQSFTQVNNKSGFSYEHRSYFSSEGDTSLQLEYAYAGDNMMNLARMSPDLLPLGDFTILPSMHYLRTSQKEIKNYYANGMIEETDDGYVYTYDIPELKRNVKFYISSKNQFRISKWEESYPTVFDGVVRTSTYELKAVKYLPYWELNNAGSIHLREELNLNN
ncbi:MAG TPA: hypothetical protein VKY37_12765 [Brumimicrobium sp.]|nr:hypothetical protein [Brumimicrobium sp.]